MDSIIVDANKVFASLIKKGIVNELLFSGKFRPVGPEKLLSEVKNHAKDISEKSGMSLEEIELAIRLIELEFKLYKRGEYSDKLKDALEIAPHPKDIEYFALALKYDFPIWTNETEFKKQSKAKIFFTGELKKYLDKL